MKRQNKGLLVALATVVLLVGGGTVAYKARGLRNNNPGNIRFNPNNDWAGQVGQDDAGYIIFDKPEYGIRAMGILLTNYYKRHGLNDVHGIITRWAPPSDNNPTQAYIDHVVDELNKDSHVKISQFGVIHVPSRLVDLSRAITKHENGFIPIHWDRRFFQEAIGLA